MCSLIVERWDVNVETRGRRIASGLRLEAAVSLARTKMMAWPPNSAARGFFILFYFLFFILNKYFWVLILGFVCSGMPRHCKKRRLRRRPVGPPPLEVEVIAVTRNNSIIINLSLYICGWYLFTWVWLVGFVSLNCVVSDFRIHKHDLMYSVFFLRLFCVFVFVLLYVSCYFIEFANKIK